MLVLILGLYDAKCQDFIRIFNFADTLDEFGNGMLVDKDKIYINVSRTCPGIGKCAYYICTDHKGDILWNRLVPWSGNGNERVMALRGDTLLCSSHGLWENNDKRYTVLLLHKATGDSIVHYDIDYNKVLHSVVANNGMVLNQDKIVLYGESTMSDDTVSGVVQVLGIDGKIGPFYEYRYPKNFLNTIWDMEVDNENNMVFIINKGSNFQNNLAWRVIKKINIKGEVLKNIESPAYEWRFNPDISNFTITEKGYYAYMNASSEISFAIPKLILSDTSGTILWEYNFDVIVSKETFYIHELSKSKDGGVLGCGEISSAINKYRSAFIFKVSADGQLVILKRYNLIKNAGEMIESTFLLDVKEMDDGSIAAIGGIRKADGSRDVMLIKVNKYGCINADSCDDAMVIVTTATKEINVDVAAHTIYPNPVSAILTYTDPLHLVKEVILYDSDGCMLMVQKNILGNTIDVSSLSGGLKIIKWVHKDGSVVVDKIMKI